jgi:hypothetical protein
MQSQEKELVDFLYNLGVGDSLIRVKVLSVQPDQTHQRLTTRVTLVASYQKKAIATETALPTARTSSRPPAAGPPPAPGAKPPAAVKTAPVPAKPAATKPATNQAAPASRPGAPKSLTPTKK